MKTALITGCEGQLGRVYVDHLRGLGYRVVGIDLSDSPARDDIEYHRADIRSGAQVRAAIAAIDGHVDVLVNNAGVAVFSPFEERTEDELDFVMDVNLKGTVLVTQAVYTRHFKPRRAGCIVNIGSIYGVVAGDMRLYDPGDRRTPEIYGATKAAVIQLTKYFAAYMAADNVRVNCISPGGVFNHQGERFVERYEQRVPMGRMAQAPELLGTLEYLISDGSSYVTGQNIVVDGGFVAW